MYTQEAGAGLQKSARELQVIFTFNTDLVPSSNAKVM